MDRRSFLGSAALGTAVAPLAAPLAAPAIAQARELVRMVTAWPRDFPGLGTGAQRLADRITAASDGRIEVRLFAAGELVAPFDCFDAVATGGAEMYHAADYYWQGKHTGFNFFTGVPMGLTGLELSAWVQFGGGQELWDELAAGFGVKSLLAGNTGMQMAGWFPRPITATEDFAELRVRIPGLGGEVLRALGAETVALPGGDIVAALGSGVIDAAEWVGPYNDLALGLHRHLKVYMYPGFQEPGSGLALGMNKAWWDRRSPADQAMIRACCAAATDTMRAEYTARDGDSLETLVREHGVELHGFPEPVFSEIAAAAEQVVADTALADDLARRIHASHTAFRSRVAPWSRLSDAAFVTARFTALGI